MDSRNIIVADFETGSAKPETAQILQIGAVIIDRDSLKIKDEFEVKLIRPDDMSTVEDKALAVNHLKREELESAPEMSVVFPTFAKWIQKYNTTKNRNSFGAPIMAGYGITNFDMPILTRYCLQYGYWDKKWGNQTLVNPIFLIDAMQYMWYFMRTNDDTPNIKLGTMLEYMGVSKEEIASGSHSALWDTKWSAKIVIKLLQLSNYLTEQRMDTGTRRLELRDCFKDTKI